MEKATKLCNSRLSSDRPTLPTISLSCVCKGKPNVRQRHKVQHASIHSVTSYFAWKILMFSPSHDIHSFYEKIVNATWKAPLCSNA